MGIFVRQGILPSGLSISNVYISFSGQPVHIFPIENSKYVIASTYLVFKDKSKSLASETRYILEFPVTDINQNVYNLLYCELKKIYPNSFDVI
jgi:hypothetical protein